MTPFLSIIIPTHNRGPILRECLRRIGRQTAKKHIEVIVVSDGPMDKETARLAKETWQVPTTFFAVEKSQQGAARNRGVKEARGEIVLFTGDDMFMEPECCEVHLERYKDIGHRTSGIGRPIRSPNPEVRSPSFSILGHVTWDPALEITPVMRWLEQTGWQFGFSSLAPYAHAFIPQTMQHRFTYTSNISLPTRIAREIPFLEGLSLYGWEDIEWGLRLREAEVPLFYEPDAKVLHHHPMTLEDSLKRMETLGTSAVLFEQLAPSLNIVPKGTKGLAYRLLSLATTMRGKHAGAFLRGLRSSKRLHRP